MQPLPEYIQLSNPIRKDEGIPQDENPPKIQLNKQFLNYVSPGPP